MALTTVEFNYTGAVQEWTVPEGVYVVTGLCWGGGGGGHSSYNNKNGGGGGFIKGLIPTIPGETLRVVVGGGGARRGVGSPNGGWGGDSTVGDGSGGRGGSATGSTNNGAGGGGRSAIVRIESGTSTVIQLLNAGGGGGCGQGLAGDVRRGGAGGGATGQAGEGSSPGAGGSSLTVFDPKGADAPSSDGFADGGGGGGFDGGNAGNGRGTGLGDTNAGGGGGGNSVAHATVVNVVTEGGTFSVPGGTEEPLFDSTFARGGIAGSSASATGQPGKVFIQYDPDNQPTQPVVTNPPSAIELNPYRASVPAEIQNLDPQLFSFLFDQTETLRKQHNLAQVGDTTYHWGVLFQYSTRQLFSLGAIGRFYNEVFGVVRARYVEFVEMDSGIPAGAPVGLQLPSNILEWKVTNQWLLSKPEFAVGVLPGDTVPVSGQFGWVIVEGPNFQSLRTKVNEFLVKADSVVWTADNAIGKTTAGATLGRVLVSPIRVFDLEGNPFNQFNPGEIYISVFGDSQITDFEDAIDDLQDADVELSKRITTNATDIQTLRGTINDEITARIQLGSDLYAALAQQGADITEAYLLADSELRTEYLAKFAVIEADFADGQAAQDAVTQQIINVNTLQQGQIDQHSGAITTLQSQMSDVTETLADFGLFDQIQNILTLDVDTAGATGTEADIFWESGEGLGQPRFWFGPDTVFASTDVDADLNEVAIGTNDFVTGNGPFELTTDGTLPGGLATGTSYWLIVDGSVIKFAASYSDSLDGSAIDLTDVGTGNHTIETAQWAIVPAGVTRIEVFLRITAGEEFAGTVSAELLRNGIAITPDESSFVDNSFEASWANIAVNDFDRFEVSQVADAAYTMQAGSTYLRITKVLDIFNARSISYDSESSTLVGVTVEEALDELDAKIVQVAADLASIDAVDVGYDNSESGLVATDVQAALDEVVQAIADGGGGGGGGGSVGTFRGLRVYADTAQSIPDGVATAKQWDDSDIDTEEWLDLVSSPAKIVVPENIESAIVELTANTAFDSNSTGSREVYVEVNGSRVLGGPRVRVGAAGSGETAMNMRSSRMELVGLDEIQLMLLQDSGGALDMTATSADNWLQMQFLKLQKAATQIVPTTWDSAKKGINVALSNGDLTAQCNAATTTQSVGTIAGVSSGKYYWECTIDIRGNMAVGIAAPSTAWNTDYVGRNDQYGYHSTSGSIYHNSSPTAYGNAYVGGDVLGLAFDADIGALWFSINGVWQKSASLAEIEGGIVSNAAVSGLSGTWYAAMGKGSTGGTAAVTANFGQSPMAYTVPAGFASGFGAPA